MLNKRKKQKIVTVFVLLAILVGLVFFLFSGGNFEMIKEAFNENATREEIQEALSGFGWRGYVTFGILSMLQVVFTFLPAEPVQVISGISFGTITGGLVCLAGVFVGNTIIYILYKIFGSRMSHFMENHAEFDFSLAKKSKRIALIIFILYFLPAIPYGLICLFTASLDTKYPRYIILTTLGSIPSILIGVGLGHIAMASSWVISIAVFLVLVILLIFMFRYRSALFDKLNKFIKKRQDKEALRTPNRIFWRLLIFVVRRFYGRKIKVKINNEVGKIKGPAIVLCNHGSFIDFVYSASILKKVKPHFVAARLYFYHKKLGKLMRYLGCFPKSMFTSDVENVKSCLRVINANEILVMMPEARLSTVGKFEGIQDSTYKFIHKMGVDVYTIYLQGDYMANPKWGSGARKGSKVVVTMKKLCDAQDVKTMGVDELKTKINSALDYDEFKWLESRPDVHYKCKKLAEGLENVLYLCPNCGERYSLKTKGHTVSCEKCGAQYVLDDRYSFVDSQPFKNFAEWYDWQTQKTKELVGMPDYELKSKVELRHGSIDGKSFTRHAGEGECVLNKDGLRYVGTEDGEKIEKFFPSTQIYRLLFGAGEDFEIYEGKEIWYFVPEERRSAVEWYVVSGLLEQNKTI